jgi:hypothetical protein
LRQEVLGGLVVWELDIGGHCKPSVDKPLTQRSAPPTSPPPPIGANDVKLSADGAPYATERASFRRSRSGGAAPHARALRVG